MRENKVLAPKQNLNNNRGQGNIKNYSFKIMSVSRSTEGVPVIENNIG